MNHKLQEGDRVLTPAIYKYGVICTTSETFQMGRWLPDRPELTRFAECLDTWPDVIAAIETLIMRDDAYETMMFEGIGVNLCHFKRFRALDIEADRAKPMIRAWLAAVKGESTGEPTVRQD